MEQKHPSRLHYRGARPYFHASDMSQVSVILELLHSGQIDGYSRFSKSLYCLQSESFLRSTQSYLTMRADPH